MYPTALVLCRRFWGINLDRPNNQSPIMLTKKSLVFVVGAGASKEAGLPMGTELKSKIARALDIRYEDGYRLSSGDRLIDSAIRHLVEKQGGRDINPYLHASRHIAAAMPQAASIDNFIDAHRGNELITVCGKLGIARCILAAEASSRFKVNNRDAFNNIEFKNLEDTWYNAFFQLIVQGARLEDIPARLAQISVITFNYDRCIETYLHAALRNYYGIDVPEATALLHSLTISHPYGDLGSLIWASSNSRLAFGAEVSAQQLIESAFRIKTFTEGTDENHSDIVAIRSTVKSAEKLIFIGFSFNSQNLALLYGSTPRDEQSRTRVFGTAYGLSESDVQEIRLEIGALGSVAADSIRLSRDQTCSTLFREFGRTLMLK